MKRAIRWILVGLSVLIVTTVAAAVWLWNDTASAFRLAMLAGHANAGLVERSVDIDGHSWRVLDSDAVDASADESGMEPLPAGMPRQRTILVLHGLGTTAEAMMTIAPIMSATHRVVIPDLPGFGDHAMHGAVAHDCAFYVDAIESFRAAENLGQVDVVGTSMGGAFAAAYAAKYPQHVRRLVLLSPAGVMPPRVNDFMKRVMAGELPLDIHDDASFAEVLRLNFPSPPPMPEPIREEFVARAQERREAFLRIVEDVRPFLTDGVEPMLPQIQAPTLVLYGALDQLTDPSMLGVWRHGLRNMEGEVLDGAGHVLLYDKPKEVATRMRAFLR